VLLLLLLLYLLSGLLHAPRGLPQRPLFPQEPAPERLEQLRLTFLPESSAPEAASGKIEYRFRRRAGSWHILHDGTMRRARSERIAGLARRFLGMKAELLSETGSPGPREAVIELSFGYRPRGAGAGEELRTTTLMVGEELPGSGARYLWFSDGEQLYRAAIPQEMLRRELSYWADLRLFPVHPAPEEVIAVELEGAGEYAVGMYRIGEDGGWHLRTGGAAAGGRSGAFELTGEANQRVRSFLRLFFSLRAAEFHSVRRAGATNDEESAAGENGGEAEAESSPVSGTGAGLLSITVESAQARRYRLEIPGIVRPRGYLVRVERPGGPARRSFILSEEELQPLQNALRRLLETLPS
jgi:hypothetical protein